MAKTLEELFPHKFSVGDTVKVVARGESEWCKIGDTHNVRVCRHDHEDGAVYVVDDDAESAYIRECNLELVKPATQKGNEWKRHRGGKQPVAYETQVEWRMRDGVTGSCIAGELMWDHQKDGSDVMSYRVVSQPQAEEAEVKNTNMGTLSYTVEIDTSPAMQALNELSAKWDQVESPFKWRDTVNELDAYIEKFTREREALIERLASEGFALLPVMTPVVGVSDVVDMSDWRNWQEGDVIVVIDNKGGHKFETGDEVTVINIDEEDATYRIEATKDDEDWWLAKSDGKFIRRP